MCKKNETKVSMTRSSNSCLHTPSAGCALPAVCGSKSVGPDIFRGHGLLYKSGDPVEPLFWIGAREQVCTKILPPRHLFPSLVPPAKDQVLTGYLTGYQR